MKTLNKFILKSYIGPFILTFFIAMFVFFMMFIFKYIDDFVGKGLGFAVLSKLFFYFSLTTIPMALPLAILLSSIMTFGNMGEHFELTAMKSSGMSLQRIMKPLIILVLFLSLAAFFFSNSILPYTNLKSKSLLYDIRESKPALLFKEGVFNNSIDDFSIRIGKKDGTGNGLFDILIYDHREMKGNNIVLYAKSGSMVETPDKMFLILTLRDGVSYKELPNKPNKNKTYPLIRDKFDEREIRFDLSEFKLSRTNEDLFKSNHQMMNIKQLNTMVDSIDRRYSRRKNTFPEQLRKSYFKRTSNYFSRVDSLQSVDTDTSYFDKLSKMQKLNVIESSTHTLRSAKAYCDSVDKDNKAETYTKKKYIIEWHRKFTLSIACLVLFFIGAPLGAIIRKGGLGMPVVVSVLFFILFHILSIVGEKLAKEDEIPAYVGMWMATVILLPIGVFFTKKATSDSSLFDVNIYLNPLRALFRAKKKKGVPVNEDTSVM